MFKKWAFVHLLPNLAVGFCPVGFCPSGLLSQWAFVRSPCTCRCIAKVTMLIDKLLLLVFTVVIMLLDLRIFTFKLLGLATKRKLKSR